MHSTGRTPWDVLGLPEGAPFRDVKTAFQRMVKRAHPDVEGGSAEAFRELLAAYETLSHAARSDDRAPATGRPAPAATSAKPASGETTHAASGCAVDEAASTDPTPTGSTPTGGARPRRATRYDAWIADEPRVRRWDEARDAGWADETASSAARPVDFTAVLRDEIARSTPATDLRRRPAARPLVVRPAAGGDSRTGATRGLSALLRRRPARRAA